MSVVQRVRRGKHGLLCGPGLFCIMELKRGATRGTLCSGPYGYRQDTFTLALLFRTEGRLVWIEVNGITAQRPRR